MFRHLMLLYLMNEYTCMKNSTCMAKKYYKIIIYFKNITPEI